MSKAKVWKMGNRWAGISARGKRVVESTKAAAMKAVGLSQSQSTKKTETKSKKNPNRRKTNLTNKGNRRRGNLQATAFKLIRIGSLVAPAISTYKDGVAHHGGSTMMGVASALSGYGGYDTAQKKFRLDLLARHWTPFLGAVAATHGIPKIAGMIRRL